jgi:hypothetical protein
MAKAKYHKSQRVFVKPVCTWAHVEAVAPKWVKGCEEPSKIAYGMGIAALRANAGTDPGASCVDIMGGRALISCKHHPFPGTHPKVVTIDRNWGWLAGAWRRI